MPSSCPAVLRSWRQIEAKIETVRYARESRVPFLGICLGFQMAVIEFARHRAGLKDAHSLEFSEHGTPVILLKTPRTESHLGSKWPQGLKDFHSGPDATWRPRREIDARNAGGLAVWEGCRPREIPAPVRSGTGPYRAI